ncbi:MAG: helix-turn-helix transcriptional regulator [Actinomycetes bacterium]
MAPKIDPDDLISPEEVAKLIGLSNPRGVSVYRKRPGFPTPVIEKGRCVLWLRADVEKWAASRRA